MCVVGNINNSIIYSYHGYIRMTNWDLMHIDAAIIAITLATVTSFYPESIPVILKLIGLVI